jgi:TP901-1 family phage major tail protein
MAANVGRNLLFKKDNAVFAAGIRTKSFTINNNPVDITSDDDSGFRTLLAESGEKQIDISLEGVTKDDVLLAQAVDGSALIDECEVVLPSGATITGDFRFNSLELGAPYNDAVTFTATVQSSGSFAYALPS